MGAGLVAGTVNTIVGSGSLITFPTLLAFGFGPVVANVSNTVGLVPGSVSGAVAYRAELRGQRPRLLVLGGGVAGRWGSPARRCCWRLPGSVFRHVVPVLILVACALVALQPRLAARLATAARTPPPRGPACCSRRSSPPACTGDTSAPPRASSSSRCSGIFIADHLQRLNATKNVLALIVNGVAAVLFIAFAHVSWEAAGLIAAGSVVGGQVGGILGRRIPAPLLRAVIIVVGVIAAVALLV